MRLICPNCSAQYEIDASLIPDEGRDVQCSNCGHNWYELPPAQEGVLPTPEPQPEMETTPEPDPEPVVEPAPEPEYESEPDVASETDANEDHESPEDEGEPVSTPEDLLGEADASGSEHTSGESEDEDWDWPKSEAVQIDLPDRPRRPAELAALEILKEEADRELAKRHEDAPIPIETQTDLALDDPRDRDTPSRALRARMARLRGEEEEDDDQAVEEQDTAEEEAAYREPRKDLLPDIDEINSSLRPAGLAKGERSEEEEAEHRRGFRVGFIGIVAAVVAGIVAYAQAPAIASVLPGSEPALIGYVDWANGVRDFLSGLFGG